MKSSAECSHILPELRNENVIYNKEEDHLVSHINQFRFRTCKNKSVSLEFFFNDGSLSGNELMHQLFHVKSMLNNVGIRALMLKMDAGRNNTRLGSLLCHQRKLGNKGWLGGHKI